MTPQEASEELKEEFELFKNCIHKADWENPDEELRKIIEANTMAIEILGQQPSEERIVEWKKDFKEYVNLLTMPRDDYNGIMEYIDELPSVTPKAEWIPVSERLPEHKGDYLVTFKLLFTYPVEVCYFDGQAWDKGQYDAVLAWMPLPEPYKAEARRERCKRY